MSKQELTPWFPPNETPIHVGVYQRGRQYVPYRYWYWNGICWETEGWHTAEEAAQNPRERSMMTDLSWRGLANPPQEKLL